MCTADPIIPATGDQYQSEIDFVDFGPSPLTFTREYHSIWGKDSTHIASPLGKPWGHTFGMSITPPVLQPTGDELIKVINPGGFVRTFTRRYQSGNPWVPGNSNDWLSDNGGNSAIAGWTYARGDTASFFQFDPSGRPLQRQDPNGWVTRYSYDASGRLATVTNAFQRSLTFGYNAAGQLTSLTTPDGRVIGYAYDTTGRLSTATQSDGSARTYLYENAAYPQALTGIRDETGALFATLTYDETGRALTGQHAGGVDYAQVSYASASTISPVSVTDALGTSRTYSYGTAFGKLSVTGGSLPAADGAKDAASRIQDANGLITSETDFKGVVTTTTWDTARRLPLTVVRALGTPDAQTTTTQWHTGFRLPVLVTESGRTTAFTYDAHGNLLSRAVTDTLVSPTVTRTTSWTYNAQQLVATETAPNGAVTSTTYDTRGNVLTRSNALGHVTSTTYDNANRVLTSTAPSGLVTAYSWDARDRLLTQKVGTGTAALTTTLTYNPTGTLATMALPSGLQLAYAYDAAHRLTGWRNNRAESGSYTLDAMGNRVSEQLKNSAGAVAWTTARTINNINRLAGQTAGVNQRSAFGYDANGQNVSTTNGLNQSTSYGLDNIRRVTSITNAANASARLNYNALDAVTSASDFKGMTTSYGRNAEGNATVQTSADTGQHVSAYDALGLPKTIVDALGQATAITRDLLGRPTQLSFADGKITTLRYDSTASGKGYLASITDRSGTTTYTRDLFGRVTLKKQTLLNNSTQSVGYSYTALGLLDTITYPGSQAGALKHLYDMTGQLNQLNWKGNPLITSLTWNPLGQPTGWKWAQVSPALTAARTYDTAGRLSTTEFGSYVYDAAGRIASLTQQLYKPGDTSSLGTSLTLAPVTWSVGYDAAGRITSFNRTGNAVGFSYDANGNRTASTQVQAGQTTSRSYTLAGTSNKLAGFSQTVGMTTTTATYAYNANGDLTGDGLRSYSHDPEGRTRSATTGNTDSSPTSRYVHNALGQRVFKTEPVYPLQGSTPAALATFRAKGWTPASTAAEVLGNAFAYSDNPSDAPNEDATLLGEVGMGGANSTGSTQYFYLPTASGPMPIAALVKGVMYAVQSDHWIASIRKSG